MAGRVGVGALTGCLFGEFMGINRYKRFAKIDKGQELLLLFCCSAASLLLFQHCSSIFLEA